MNKLTELQIHQFLEERDRLMVMDTRGMTADQSREHTDRLNQLGFFVRFTKKPFIVAVQQEKINTKRYIGDLVYDTEDAELIEFFELSKNREDANYWREDLYRTPNGRWFWHLYGGPESKYPKQRLEPTTEEEVFEALIEADCTELAAKYFKHLFRKA